MASDVDLVVLSDTPGTLEDARWFGRLRPAARLIRSTAWGPVRECRFRFGLGIDRGIGHRSLELGHRTQDWLATSDDPEVRTSGGYWYHQHRQEPHPSVYDIAFQDRLLSSLADETGEHLPRR